MAKSIIKGSVNQSVTAETVHLHQRAPEVRPPDDPTVSIRCAQCGHLTWRYTRHCLHCDLDLARWHARQRWARVVRRIAEALRRAPIGDRCEVGPPCDRCRHRPLQPPC